MSEAYSRKIYCENSINFHFSEGGGGRENSSRRCIAQYTGDNSCMPRHVKNVISVNMAMPMIKNLQQEVYLSFGKSSIVVKVVAVAVTIGYFLSYAKSVVPFLAVTPGYVLPPNFWVWTFVTHSFIEFHFWEVLADIAVLILCGKLLEPLWGALDMLIFLAVVNTGVALASSFLYIGIYLVTKNEEYLFETYIHGLVGYVAGFSVAVKQVMPDHKLLSSPFGTLRNTHIPLLLMFVTITLRLINVVDGPYPFMFGFGILISWTYLRFYQKHSNGNRGDMADQFSFARYLHMSSSTLVRSVLFLLLRYILMMHVEINAIIRIEIS